MATPGGIADDLLVNLAEDIETGEQVESLGRALGFSSAALNRYTETNRLEGRVTSKGTRGMLFDWRQTVEPSYQHLRLKEALIEAKLIMLADTSLKDTPSIQDIYSKKISESLSVKQCREKLKSRYLNYLCKIKMAPWDPNKYAEFKDMHTVVTMVKKDTYGRDTGKKEILQGSINEILTVEVNGVLPRRILISAPAGRGKTTAVAKMAYDWANRVRGSSLENLPLLFVVKLRNANKHASIAEAIRSQLLSDVLDLTQDGLHRFIADNQGICHIILDGLDEYAGIAANGQGLGSNIVDVMQWKEYPHCRVLVTTRPHLENFFNQEELPMVYTKVWIEGFSRKSSREYIDKFFSSSSNSSKGQDLKVYLDDQPLINELVITPLFCLMVCHLWNENLLGSYTKTQTDLLDNVNVFLMHHANARSKSKYNITHDKLNKTICKLGKVALTGLLDDSKKLVFTPRDFRWVPAILERTCELGILSKTTTQLTGLPPSHETSSTSIEFYHKLAQEHSAGKYLADQTNKYLLGWKISKLDRVLQKIRANISDYENLLRFAAGTKNRLCIRIMEVILDNSFLDESERYRILLDCSSETTGTEQGVSSLVQRCVSAQRILLKSPTVYTVEGMQNLPWQLKQQVRQVILEGSAIGFDVTNGLWSCLGSFAKLQTITISDSSLSFFHSPPELPSVTKLKAERVTSHSYEGLISSMPGLKEIDVTIDDDVEGNTSHVTASSQSGDRHLPVHIKLQTLPSRSRDEKIKSRTTTAEMSLLIREATGDRQWLQVTGLKGRDEEALVNLFIISAYLKSFNVRRRRGSLKSDRQAGNNSSLTIRNCELTAMITSSMWSFLRSFPTLSSLTISDSSLSFPPSPPDLTSVTELKAESLTSQSYEGLLSSLPGVEEIEVTIDDAERDISQITAGLRQTGGQQLARITLAAPTSLQPQKKKVSRETMRRLGVLIKDQANNVQRLVVSGVNSGDEEDLVALIECCRRAKALDYLLLLCCGSKSGGRLESYAKDLLISKERLRVLISHEMSRFDIEKCQLSTEMTIMLWYSLSFFTSLSTLTISDSSLSFPPSPPELTSVTELKAESVTSQSYEGLLSSLSGLEVIDITIDNAERDMSQITAGLRRTGGQQLTDVYLHAPDSLPQEKKTVSRETMKGLGLLIKEQTKNLQKLWLDKVRCTDEEGLVYLIECCGHVKAMEYVVLRHCGTIRGGRLESYLQRLPSSGDTPRVCAWHDTGEIYSGTPLTL